MRLLKLIIGSILCLFAAVVSGQPANEDPYSVTFVEKILQARSEGIINAKSQTYLARMGDAVSIAILKIFNENELADQQKVSAFLPIIRAAFSEPHLVTNDIDKKPKVTIFLLKHIQVSMADSSVQREIQETIQFVRQKTEQ